MSKSWFRELPLVLQPIDGKNWICTASCLAMLFQSGSFSTSNLPNEQNEIANHILKDRPGFTDQKYCDNILALRYLSSLGIKAALISVDNPVTVLEICQRKGIEAIIFHRPEPTSGSHTVVFSFMQKGYIFVNDPLPFGIDPENQNLNKAISCYSLPSLTARINQYDQEIVVPNTLLVLLPPDSSEEMISFECPECHSRIELPKCLAKHVKYSLCSGLHKNSGPWKEYRHGVNS